MQKGLRKAFPQSSKKNGLDVKICLAQFARMWDKGSSTREMEMTSANETLSKIDVFKNDTISWNYAKQCSRKERSWSWRVGNATETGYGTRFAALEAAKSYIENRR